MTERFEVFSTLVSRLTKPHAHYSLKCESSLANSFSVSLESARLSEAGSRSTEDTIMIARHVTLRLRADSLTKFARLMENGVIPLLREQEGFLDHIILISAERVEAIVITFWESKVSEEAFNRTRNPEVLSKLLEVIEGSPGVSLFEVASATPKKINDERWQEAGNERLDKEYQRA
jgi:heme-degrading monooxygenase HmoA